MGDEEEEERAGRMITDDKAGRGKVVEAAAA